MCEGRALWLTLLACTTLASGCELTGKAPPRYENDPLVLSKKPVTGTVTDTSPVLVASAEPVPPPIPEVALASATRTDTFSAKISDAGAKSVVKSADYLPPPAQAPTAPPAAKAPGLPEAPVAVGSAQLGKTSVYARADDFSWLQGVLEWDASGTLALRYNAAPSKDPVYGRVALLFDPPLKEIKEGDVIRVWGKFVSPDTAISPHGPPRYRVDQLLLVRAHNS